MAVGVRPRSSRPAGNREAGNLILFRDVFSACPFYCVLRGYLGLKVQVWRPEEKFLLDMFEQFGILYFTCFSAIHEEIAKKRFF